MASLLLLLVLLLLVLLLSLSLSLCALAACWGRDGTRRSSKPPSSNDHAHVRVVAQTQGAQSVHKTRPRPRKLFARLEGVPEGRVVA